MGIGGPRYTGCFICGSIRCPSADGQSECGLACGRQEQNCRNAQLVPIYRDQPANEHRRVLGARCFFVNDFL